MLGRHQHLGSVALTAALLVTRSSGSLAAAEAPAGGSQGLSCSIQQELTDGAVRLRGIAGGTGAGQGRYAFRVAKTGPAGTSNISQGGEFLLGAGSGASVGQVSLGLEPEARYEAVLTVEMNGDRRDCRISGPPETKL